MTRDMTHDMTQGRAIQGLYFEDVEIGREVQTVSHTVTMDDIAAFANVTRDHHPLHTDVEYCRSMGFDRPIAHGLFGLSLIEGLKSELKLYENTSIASLGWDGVRFLKPIFAGDTVHVKVVFQDKRPSRSGGRGIVVEDIALINQDDVVVTEAKHTTLLVMRGAAP